MKTFSVASVIHKFDIKQRDKLQGARLAVIFERCKTAQIVTFIQGENNFKIKNLTCSDFIVDIAIEEYGIFVFGTTRLFFMVFFD